MAFRADEAARSGREEVESYFIPRARDASDEERERSRRALSDIIGRLGPVVDAYPTWHPLVAHHDGRFPTTRPSTECGYEGLDHTRLFAHGFITCPYGDGDDVLKSVAALPRHSQARVAAERLDVTLYNIQTTPILVSCEWDVELDPDGTIPLSRAAPLLLEKELPNWLTAQVGETWETMRPYFLGRPHGSRSSLFIAQETGQSLKTLWNALIQTKMFGPIKT
jgi:hypothetical protein